MPPIDSPRDIARLLLAQERASGNPRGGQDDVAALQRSCTRLADAMRDAMGTDGSDALLARALARTASKHPAIASVRQINGNGVQLDGVAAAVEKHGLAEVTTAVEALFEAVVDVLARLIGEDMVVRLIDPDGALSRGSDGKQPS